MNARLLTPQDYIRALASHKWLIVGSVIMCTGIAWLLCLYLPKSYRSTTLMLVEEPKVLHVRGVDSATDGPSPDKVAALHERVTAMRQILLSRKFLAQVAHELHLYGYDKNLTTPMAEDGVVKGMRGLIKIELSKDRSFLNLSFADENPKIARDVTARLAELFIEENSRTKEEIAETSTEFLQQELDALKIQLEAREKAIAEFKKANLGELPEQLESNLRAVDRLEAEQVSQREMVKSFTLRLASLEKSIRDYEEQDGDEAGPRRIRDLRLARIKELERSLVGLTAVYKETYPDIVQIKEEIRKLKSMTTEEYVGQLPEGDDGKPESVGRKKGKGRILDQHHADLLRQRDELLQQIEMAKTRESRIAAEIQRYQVRLDRAPIHKQKLMALERDYENLQKNYQALLEKQLHAGIAGNLEKRHKGTQFTVIDPANLPVLPEKPNIFMIMLGGIGIGCALGIGGAIGLELLRRGFSSADEVELVLGLPVLVSIPTYESALGGTVQQVGGVLRQRKNQPLLHQSGARPLLTQYKLEGEIKNGKIKGDPLAASRNSPGLELVTMWRPRSLVAEQFRVAATRLELMVGERKTTVIVVTSALMGEGKSCTSLNLAYILARDLDKKTVLVDCDLKRPMQHVYVGTESRPGLVELLHGESTLEECLKFQEGLGFWILPSGAVGDGPPALSKMQQLADLLTNLRSQFEYIIVDAPPILPLADMNVLASMADLVTLVIRAGTTGRDAVQKALKTIGEQNPLAIVLNGVEVQDTPYYMQQMYYHEAPHEQLK